LLIVFLDIFSGKWAERLYTLRQLGKVASAMIKNRDVVVPFYELFTAPASHILDRCAMACRLCAACLSPSHAPCLRAGGLRVKF
jgi:hypothetical protein